MLDHRHPFMMVLRRRTATTLCVTALGGVGAGCAPYQRYHAVPLEVVAPADQYRVRQLTDSGLARFLATAGLSPADSQWSPTRLALASLYFRGELSVARATVAETQAAEITAGVRPPPSVDGTVSRTARPLERTGTPWSESISATFTLELGGKRAARVASARAATLGARLRAEATAWQLAHDARGAALDALAADQDVADMGAETHALGAVAGLLRGRYAEGQLSLAEVARAEAEVQTAAVSVAAAERARIDARLALARAVGVPFESIDTLPLRAPPGSSCDVLESPIGSSPAHGGDVGGLARQMRDSLAASALRERPDVGAALADYAVAEGALRLEVARQYPDLTLGPGLLWDQGIPGWVLSAALPALLLRRNRGPIAEAKARRTAQAARVRLLGDSVLAAVDSGVAACRGVRREIATADSLVAVIQQQVDLAQRAYERGEAGQTEFALARLALLRARRAQRVAIARRTAAGAALDRAAGRWAQLLDRGPWPDPAASSPDATQRDR